MTATITYTDDRTLPSMDEFSARAALALLILLSRKVRPFGLWLGGRRKRESGVSPGLPRSGMWERLRSSSTGPAGLGSDGQ
jgi:hypothetical protein